MSVIVTIESEIKDIRCVEEAIKALNKNNTNRAITITKNSAPRYYSGTGPVCDYVVVLPDRYDLGLKKNGNKFEIVADNELIGGRSSSDRYGKNDLGRALIGEDCRFFKQECAVAAIEKAAKKKGQKVKRINNANGTISLRVI